MKHPHAELMAQYAQDAMETDKPWERWDFYSNQYGMWKHLASGNPYWDVDTQYRRRPKPYEPTLLDQALELEIEAKRLRINYFADTPAIVQKHRGVLDGLKSIRTPEMIEHLKQQGKL